MMDSDILKKVHKIEIKAKGLSRDVFSGQYRSAFKGRGMTFSEVREYTYGDEVRSIDWNVSARFNHPFIKVFEEERELTIMLMIDVSGSTIFGSKNELKTEIITEIAATIAFSASSNNDKVGAILFSDKIDLFIPPKKGSAHCLRIIRELLSFRKQEGKTSFHEPFEYINNVIKKRCTCFLITDGFGEFDKGLTIFSRKHDVCSIIVNDQMESELPNLGLVLMKDAESNQSVWIDTSNKKTREKFYTYRQEQKDKLEKQFKKLGMDYVSLLTTDDYTKALIKLFAKRERL
ncbi:MAG: DUF58 domain-containing protein [Bacteroidales bacterium]|nr:DUF58 domain-containing protein [Candidatus Scybalousia scybalohippi]